MLNPYLASRDDLTDALALIDVFGPEAGFEAQVRADRSRDVGNHLHFCRWRQIERMILLLGAEHAVGVVQ